MPPIIYTAENEAATAALGHALAEILPPGTTVALCGTLGAGKTRLVQAIAEGLGVQRRDVVSPTFVLMQEYHGRRTLYHIDAYRLRDDDEFQQLGPDEFFESDGVVLIEWADRVERSLPREHLEINIDVTGAESRRFEIRALGRRYEAVLHALAAKLVAC
jgi:tRNA threonylcarbamoyladenosine biosynthesis protein TsaE